MVIAAVFQPALYGFERCKRFRVWVNKPTRNASCQRTLYLCISFENRALRYCLTWGRAELEAGVDTLFIRAVLHATRQGDATMTPTAASTERCQSLAQVMDTCVEIYCHRTV